MRKPITEPDRANLSQNYWDRVLESHGLFIEKGSPSSRRVSRIGGLNELVGIEEEELRHSTGRVSPKGKGPDK